MIVRFIVLSLLISSHCSVCLSELLCDSVIMMDHDTQWLYQLLASVQLERFYIRMRDGLNVTRIEHLNYVKETDLERIGISRPGMSCKICYLKIVILFDFLCVLKAQW